MLVLERAGLVAKVLISTVLLFWVAPIHVPFVPPLLVLFR